MVDIISYNVDEVSKSAAAHSTARGRSISRCRGREEAQSAEDLELALEAKSYNTYSIWLATDASGVLDELVLVLDRVVRHGTDGHRDCRQRVEGQGEEGERGAEHS